MHSSHTKKDIESQNGILLFMMPGSKGLSPHEFTHKREKDLGTRPDMEQNIQWMFALLRPKRSVDIKVERKFHDMRMLGRIVRVRSTEQSVRYL